jgi:synaptojanin
MGVVRTNCIDCLDRTNVAKQVICMKVLDDIVGMPGKKESWAEALIYLWAMGGDQISKQYSGTESVLTKYTLKGYQNLADKIEQKMISVKRWRKQTLTDDFKQQCILLLQGLDPGSHDVVDDFVE